MAANDNVTVRIVGDASGVQPAIEEAGASLGGLEGLLTELNASMRALTAQMAEGFSAGAAEARKMAAGIEATTAATHGAAAGMAGMVGRIHEGAESVRTFQMRAKEFAEVYVAMFAVDRISEWIAKMGEASEKIEHLSERFGLPISQIQALGGVATATGIPLDALVKGMQFLDRNMANAAMGAKNTKQAMDAVGISLNDGRNQMEKLAAVADKFKDMDDGPKKVALAMQLFGRSGAQLIPILNLGSEGIERLSEKMKEYGVENEGAVQKGMALAESVNETKLGFAGLGNVLTDALAPALKTLVDGVNEMIRAFIQSYQQGGLVKQILDIIGAAIDVTVEIVKAFGEIFSEVWGIISELGAEIGQLLEDVFGKRVPGSISATDQALNLFHQIIVFTKDVVLDFVDVVGLAFKSLGQTVATFGKIAWDALTLNWGAIEGDWASGLGRIKGMVEQTANQIRARQGELSAAFHGTLQFPKSPKTGIETGKGSGDFDYSPSGGGSKKKKGEGMSLAEKLEAELEQKKTAWAMEQDAQGTFQQYSLQSEADFWAQALQRSDLSAKDRLAIEKKFLAARQALKKDEIQAQLDGYQDELEAAGANWNKKLEILRAEQAYKRRMYGDDSREARQAAEDIVRAEREKAAQIRELEAQISKGKEDAALAGVDAEEASAQFEVDMGRRTAGQLLAQDKQFENQRYQIRRQALIESLQLAELDPNTSPAKLRQIYGEIEALDRQHQSKLTQLDRQASLERTQMARQAFQQIGQSFGDHISKMITLQEGWKQGLIGIYQDLVGVVANVISQIIAKWVTAFLTKLLLGKQEAAQEGINQIGLAGAGGTASMAAAPFPLNLTAPAFGASMAGIAAGWTAGISAEGGDLNVREGLYNLHKEEMVLPAWAAGPLRSMIGAARGGGDPAKSGFGGGGDTHLHFAPNVYHADQSIKDSLKRQGRDMRRWLERGARNGRLPLGQMASGA